MKKIVFACVLSIVSTMATAAEQTVQLLVPDMNCSACPITVKKSLQKVNGVKSASVDYDSKTATVVFDDAVTTTQQLMDATKNAGYPSSVK